MEKAAAIEILLIEGDLAVAGEIREMLSEPGRQIFSVHHVAHLADGLGLLLTRSFDAILAGLALPDSHGLETALSIRNRVKTTPIIVIILPDDEEAVLKTLQSDIQDYLIEGRITGEVLKRSIRYVMQRKRDTEAFQQCEQWFASFMRYLPAAAWAKDLHGRYVYANEGDERIFSMPFSEFSGKRDEDFLPPETASQLRKNDEQVVVEGVSLQTVEFLRQADGVEHHYMVHKFPLPGSDGRTAYVAGIALDITERVNAEEAVRQSERMFTKVFQEAPALFSISSLQEGTFIDVNDTMLRTLGYGREEMIGRTALELGIWEDTSDREAIVQALEEKGSAKSMEVRFRGKSGQSFVGLFSAEYIDIEGERYMLSLVKDVTEKRLAQEQIERLNTELAARAAELEAANRELEAFNYTVAHDLRNPLNVINGYAQIMKQACGDKLDERCKGYLQATYDGTLRMNGLITALLDFSRMARAEIHRETFDISELAREVATELRQIEPERRVAFKIADGITVDGDPNLLRIVLDNLMGNAWKYTAIRSDAVIEFGAATVDGITTLFVRDNGPGFSMAEADKLFAPFQRLSATEKQSGFGIGLATVARIIHRHGGRIWAEGEPGKGATFFFSCEDR